MSVFKRKTTSGKTREFHYRFMKSGKLYTGVCTGCYDKASAELFENEIKSTANNLAAQRNVKALVENFRDELSGGERIKLKDAFELSLRKPRKRNANDKQIALKRSRFNDFVAFMSKKHPDISCLSQVHKRHAEEYITLLRTKGCFNKTVRFKNHLKGHAESKYKSKIGKLSAGTTNAYHNAIKEVFSLLADDAGIYKNHFTDIPILSYKPESREAFTEKELELIIKHATPFVRPIFIIGFFTALREGDIATLRWSDVLWDRGIIRRKLLKTGNVVEIPMMPPLAAFLKEQVGNDDEFVLPEHAAMYDSNPSGISYRVKKFLEEDLGIQTTKKVSGRTRVVSIKDVHSLRHTFCYFAGVAGIPLVVVQSIVGHMTPDMTAHYTAHADLETKREKMKLLPGFSGMIEEIRRTNLIEQTRRAIIQKVMEADDDTLNRIASIIMPLNPKRSLLRNKELGMSK